MTSDQGGLSVLDTSVPERATLMFSIEGVSPRDELLFKSFVRLLSHRTSQSWCYEPQSAIASSDANSKIDLRVVAEGLNMAREDCHQPVLMLGTCNRKAAGYLSLPLKAQELEDELNRVGALIASKRHWRTVNPTLLAPNAAKSAAGSTDIFRLVRWPPVTLLKSPARMRLATLLTGRGLTINAIEQRSGETARVCIDFLDELYGAGLIVSRPHQGSALPTPPSRSAHAVLTGKPGLLTRIRSRLGLQLGART